MSDFKYEDPKASKVPIVTLATRVTTLATLAVSMSLLRSNSVTYKVGPFPATFNYNNVSTYEYVFFAMVVGFGYNLLHVPFAMYFFFTKKRLINNNAFFDFEFYGDKTCFTILATAVGSLFGATVETRKAAFAIPGFEGGYDANDYHSKVEKFCVMAYVSGAFLLVGFFSSMISSISSSKVVSNKS
ncbi:hypothetical protein QVD17_29117 [Tagetes erecta]|uniref:CASP-like protein n=1 Tax=Tagetes erecta TaxID=13708 RepID=A0AAD8KHN4_TARER|nr:hypothetical protein QVD17_29117 [Tagetes erecta]